MTKNNTQNDGSSASLAASYFKLLDIAFKCMSWFLIVVALKYAHEATKDPKIFVLYYVFAAAFQILFIAFPIWLDITDLSKHGFEVFGSIVAKIACFTICVGVVVFCMHFGMDRLVDELVTVQRGKLAQPSSCD